MTFLKTLTVAAGLGLAATGGAQAGSSQATDPVLPIEDVTAFASQVEQMLAARGARVALVARMGRDPADLPDGVRYTHVGFWVYSEITQGDGRTVRGYRAHNLYQRADDLSRSDLVEDGAADFFAGAQRLDAGVIIPDPRLQAKLLKALTGPAWEDMHNPRYSLLANPENNAFQNCTEHSLNVVMSALYDTRDMGRIKANIAAHFPAQRIDLNPLVRTFGPSFVGGVETADHGRTIRTATFSTLARFMDQHGLTSEVLRQTKHGVSAL